MVKKLLLVSVCMFMGLNAVVKTTKILDFEYQLNTDVNNAKKFINKTGKKLWFRYAVTNPKTGDFARQEPVVVPQGWIKVDYSNLGAQILPAGYGKVKISLEVAKVTQTPEKKMDELCACRFKNGKKDLIISRHQFDENAEFELYLDSKGYLACKCVELSE